MALHERRTGGRKVAHGAQRPAIATGSRASRSSHGGQHGATAQPFGGVVLVVHGHLHQYRVFSAEGRNGRGKPRGQAVGVYGDGKRHPRNALRRQHGQRALQLLFEQPNAVDMLAKLSPRLCCPAGLIAYHQRAAYALLQQSNAL